jgi:predicted HTH domain antitoxin
MSKENKIITALIFLSFSIILSAVILSISINNLSNEELTIKIKNEQENIMSLEEAANYLGITSRSLEKTMETTSVGIPFLKIEGNYIFTKKGLDEWLADNHIDLD